MSFPRLTIFVIFCIVVGITYLAKFLARRGSTERPLPPGPKGLPLVGNVYDLPPPGTLEYEHWLKHKDVYGPISSVTVMGQTFIIINDAQIALELLRDKAASTSMRPHMEFAGSTVGHNRSIVMCNDMTTLRTHRTNFAKVIGSAKSLKLAHRVQEEEAARFIARVLESPEKLFEHIKMEAGAVILKLTYGYNVNPRGRDRLVDLAGKVMDEFSDAATPGKWMVDLFPFLKYVPEWMPGTSWKQTGRTMAQHLEKSVSSPYSFVKHQMSTKTHRPSFVSQALESLGSSPAMDSIHKWSAASMYLAGSDTTVCALTTFFLAMQLFPSRKPPPNPNSIAADRARLPYIWATVLELHRWHPVGPMALPHSASTADSVRGYRVPKGAIISSNVWWFTHDPDVYADPMSFRPERFIDTPSHKAEPDPRNWTFGFGRRICPGRQIADNALFVTIAQALAVFDVRVPVGEARPEARFEAGLVSGPVKYRVCMRPRSGECVERIRRARELFPWEESDERALEESVKEGVGVWD